ncbi:MAG TPA: hypothetical protein VFN53_09210, partial [Acidobacteriaceae bacterium]|nr:hypothetical protein [Acidobacteriaceae bacterium]
TEIEEHFQRRRGTLLMLSTLDWALIAAWQEAGFPLQAVMAGIDATFDKYEARKVKGRVRRINGLAYCAQEVLRAVEDMHEAATGASRKSHSSTQESGFEQARVVAYLRSAGQQLQAATVFAEMQPIVSQVAGELSALAHEVDAHRVSGRSLSLEQIEQKLLALEDQIFAALQTFSAPGKLAALREQSAQELAPYRSRLQTSQIRQIEQQFMRRRIFEGNHLPRLSLFYMEQQ